MKLTESLSTAILDTLSLQIAVIDSTSRIVYVNHAWKAFGLHYGLPLEADWTGISYIDICQANEDTHEESIIAGVQQVLSGETDRFTSDYLCHTPTQEPTWLTLHVCPLQTEAIQAPYYLVSLTNITHHKQAEHEFSELTMTDPLTTLANRRKLEMFLRDEWSRAVRHQSSLSVMMIDADYFKLLNDSMGHAAGDECLRKLAEILKKFTNRPGDLAARYGGEEFVLILGQTSVPESMKIAERIRQKVMDLNVRFAGDRLVTVSIGIASVGAHHASAQKLHTAQSQLFNISDDGHFLIEQADKALYYAKKQGRNRVEVYDKNNSQISTNTTPANATQLSK